MDILCGKDRIDIAQISYIHVSQMQDYYLDIAEKQNNGPFHYRSKVVYSLYTDDVQLLNDYWYEVSWALMKVGPNGDGKRNWKQMCDLTRTATFEMDYSGVITWEYKVNYGSDAAGWPRIGFEKETLDIGRNIIPALARIVKFRKQVPSKKSKGLFADIFSSVFETPMEQADRNINITSAAKASIKPLYERLVDIQEENEEIEKRYQLRQAFIRDHKHKNGLVIGIKNSETRVYIDGLCGFDIDEKLSEIEKMRDKLHEEQELQEIHETKLKNSDNKGERDVEYALKWIQAANPNIFIPITGDCESKHRYNCILLSNPGFIDIPQEFDHILVSCAGLIVIETKYWKDTVEIREDGKWIRKTNEGELGVESPKMQMQRHETLLRSILPDVPVHSLLCFSHSSIIINGREHFKHYPIVTLDCLDDAIKGICSVEKYKIEEMRKIAKTIESFKTNQVQ